MKKLLSIFAIVIGLTLSMNTFAGEKADAPKSVEGAKTVTAEDIFALMDEDLIIIDSRKEHDYKAGHIEGAVNLLNDNTNAETLAEIVPAKDAVILFYCNGPKCHRSSDATAKAVAAGYTNVNYYYDGIADWKEQDLPLIIE